MDLQATRRVIDLKLAKWTAARAAERKAKERMAAAGDALTNVLKARGVIQATAQAVQTEAHRQVTSLVSRCLEAVYGDEAYELVLTFDRKRGKTDAVLEFARDGLRIDPLTEGGGGPADVAAFALRLAAVLSERPERRRCLILDEPFRHVDADRIPVVRELLERLSAELKVQIILVTHSKELECGNVIRL